MKKYLVGTVHAANLIALVALSMMFASTSVLAEEIIVDNRDANTSQVGSWSTSSGSYPYLGNSVYSTDGRFYWYPELPKRGEYDVYAWWTYHSKRSDNVPYDIETYDSTVQVNVDQHDPELGGQWNLLGRIWHSHANLPPYVVVSSENGMASADAVKFVLVEKPKVWPEASCPCDEYFSRAVDKYLGWGGSLIPPGNEGGADTVVCDDPADTLDLDARYSTNVNGGTVSLHLNIYVDNRGRSECSAWVSASFLTQSGSYGPFFLEGFDAEWGPACRASVFDFCKSD